MEDSLQVCLAETYGKWSIQGPSVFTEVILDSVLWNSLMASKFTQFSIASSSPSYSFYRRPWQKLTRGKDD